MALVDTVESLRADVEELKAFVEEAQQAEVKKLLKKDLKRLEEMLEDAEEEEEEARKKEAKKKKQAEAAAAEKAAAEAAAAEKAAAKKKEKEERAAAATSAVTTSGGLNISAEANAAMKKIKSGLGSKPKDTAFIANIGGDGKTLEYQEWLEDATIEDIADEMTLDPAYIFYSYTKTKKDGRLTTPLVFLYYSPAKAPPKKLMQATRWKNEVSKHFEVVKTLEIRDLEDLDQDWFDSVS